MDTRQINYFLAVSRTLNFTEGAQDCFVSQSTISEQICKLEKELQCLLLERNKRNVRLTAEGEIYRETFEAIMKQIEETKEQIEGRKRGVKGKISFAALPTTVLTWLPMFMAEFKQVYPDAQMMFKEYSSGNIEQALLEHAIDFGITTLPADNHQFETLPLYKEKLVLIMPENHPLCLTNKKKLRLQEIGSFPFITYDKGYNLREIVRLALFEAGVDPQITLELGRIGSILRMVRYGHGIAMIPETMLHYTDLSHIYWCSIEQDITRTVGLISRKNAYQTHIVRECMKQLINHAPFQHLQ